MKQNIRISRCLHLVECAAAALGNKDGTVLAVGLHTAVEQRKRHVGSVELGHERTLNILCLNALNAQNLNVHVLSAVTGGQVIVGLGDCSSLRNIAELLGQLGVPALLAVVDHVDRVVAGSDLLVTHNPAGEDISTRSLHLVLVTHQLPELRLSNDKVGGKYLKLVDSRLRVLLRGRGTADNLVVLQMGTHLYLYLRSCFKHK